MPDVTALRKHPCPKCGGDAEWNPALQALACPYCGEVLPWKPGDDTLGESIREHDLLEALGNATVEERGWREEKKSVKCQSCQAISVFDPQRVAQRCEFCGSPSIVAYEETKDAITPESLLPVKLSQPQVRDALRKWYQTRWFAPDRLKKAALTDTLHGIYLPYWTFDAHIHADWTAESGHYYYVTESYTDSNGQRRTRQDRRVRWEPSAGELEHFFDDDLVPGTTGVRLDLLRKVEPFPTSDLKPYDPAFVRGWTVERYQVGLEPAADMNFQQMENAVRSMCAQQVPGDTHRNLEVQTRYQGRTFKHILVPIWLVTYTYGPKVFQIIMNGYTGQIAGERPTSWIKVFFYIILPAIILLIIFLMMQR
ncbi:MAG: zinc ribbon domain-containing protein [Verrucomicrobiales bacterium]